MTCCPEHRNDSQYGLINEKITSNMVKLLISIFKLPDFVTYDKSNGAVGVRIESTEQLCSGSITDFRTDIVTATDCPFDSSENDK